MWLHYYTILASDINKILLYILYSHMNFIFPFRKKCANVVNEIFFFLFLICLLSNTCSYIPVSFAWRAKLFTICKALWKKLISFFILHYITYGIWKALRLFQLIQVFVISFHDFNLAHVLYSYDIDFGHKETVFV